MYAVASLYSSSARVSASRDNALLIITSVVVDWRNFPLECCSLVCVSLSTWLLQERQSPWKRVILPAFMHHQHLNIWRNRKENKWGLKGLSWGARCNHIISVISRWGSKERCPIQLIKNFVEGFHFNSQTLSFKRINYKYQEQVFKQILPWNRRLPASWWAYDLLPGTISNMPCIISLM